MIVSPHPVGRIVLNLLNGFEQVMVKPVVANGSVVAFDIGVLLRIAGLDVLKPDTSAFGPGDEGSADVLRAVIATNDLRLASPLDDLI